MTPASNRILIIEDDFAVRRVLTLLFETNGFRVVAADTCELGICQAQEHRPDICVLDLGLPDRDGVHFIRGIRQSSSVPIIVLTARIHEAQRLAVFEAGADDYVIKPFSSAELLARVRAIMRRLARGAQPSIALKLGNTSVNLATRSIRGPGGDELKLTPLEHRILECLVRRADGVVTHTDLLREVWGPHQKDIRSLRVYVASLRRKLERDPAQPRFLLTEAGVGYRLETDAEVRESAPVGLAAQG